MTNTELIQAIRNEIERRLKYTHDWLRGDEKRHSNQTFVSKNYYKMKGDERTLDALISFLDTLESEKPMNPEDAMKELNEKIALVKQRGTWDGVDVDKYMDEVRGREPEKPMNLGERIGSYNIVPYIDDKIAALQDMWRKEKVSFDWDDLKDMIEDVARHFAKWGAEHLKK